MRKRKHIVLGVTGSIAAYKAAELVRLMRKQAWDVAVIMTQAAARFVGELTFRTLSGHPVVVDMFAETEAWRPTHIALANRADVLVIAPCTANVIAKLAHGIADDALTAAALACRAPLVIAPAMNEGMWEHPATQANLRILKARGVFVADVERGELACGIQGQGRLASLDAIMKTLKKVLRPVRREGR